MVFLASERQHLTFKSEAMKVTAQPRRFFNFRLFLCGDTSNDMDQLAKETQSGSDVNAWLRRLRPCLAVWLYWHSV